MASTGITRPPVIFCADGLGEDDRAFPAQLVDQNMVARRKIDVIGGITAPRGAHVDGIERVFEREGHAIHRHGIEIGIAPEFGIEFGSALQSIGEMAEHLANRRRPLGQRPERGMQIIIAAAGHRSFAADIEGGQRIDLPGLRHADDHAILLHDRGVGGGRLHPAEFDGRALIEIVIGQHIAHRHGLRRKSQRRTGAHRALDLWHVLPVFGHQKAADPVIGPRPRDGLGDNLHQRGFTCFDRCLQPVDCRFFDPEGRF